MPADGGRSVASRHCLLVIGKLPIVEVVEFGLRVVAGQIDAGKSHERAGEEAAVTLVHVIVGQDLRIEPDWNLGEMFSVKGIFVGIVFRADLGAQPYRLSLFGHYDGVILEERRILVEIVLSHFDDPCVTFLIPSDKRP